MTEIITVKCPTCQNSVQWLPDNTYRPFCCLRCKMIDLGEWADEKYAVAAREEEPLSDLLIQE